jgi:hypothetical protein
MQIRQQYSTKNRILELIGNLREMHDALLNQKRTVNLSRLEWVYPISLLPLVAYGNYNDLSISCIERNWRVNTYLRSICFPQGTTSLDGRRRDYLPITRIACTTQNRILTRYEETILRKVPEKLRDPFCNSLKYLTSELEANVREHARVKHYWILAQYWSTTETCEVAICDSGIGYRASYRGTPFEVKTHIDAIVNALKGKSSKSMRERGAGIPSIIKMFIEGYGGEVIIMSGDSLLYLDQKQQIAYRFGLEWQGAFVGLRFKLKELNIYDYL